MRGGPNNNYKSDTERLRKPLLLWTALSAAFLILGSLMGPAIAVLAIPALQWITTPKIAIGQLEKVNNNMAPSTSLDSWFFASSYCNSEDFSNEDYLCTLDPFGVSLGGWIASPVVTNGVPVGFASEDHLTFQLNYSAAQHQTATGLSLERNLIWWAPGRQVVSWLSWTYDMLRNVSLGGVITGVENGQGYVESSRLLSCKLYLITVFPYRS